MRELKVPLRVLGGVLAVTAAALLAAANGYDSLEAASAADQPKSTGKDPCLQAAVKPGAAVRIELDDSIVLGEAIYCRQERDGHLIGIELDQVLVGLTELGRRLAAYSTGVPIET